MLFLQNVARVGVGEMLPMKQENLRLNKVRKAGREGKKKYSALSSRYREGKSLSTKVQQFVLVV